MHRQPPLGHGKEHHTSLLRGTDLFLSLLTCGRFSSRGLSSHHFSLCRFRRRRAPPFRITQNRHKHQHGASLSSFSKRDNLLHSRLHVRILHTIAASHVGAIPGLFASDMPGPNHLPPKLALVRWSCLLLVILGLFVKKNCLANKNMLAKRAVLPAVKKKLFKSHTFPKICDGCLLKKRHIVSKKGLPSSILVRGLLARAQTSAKRVPASPKHFEKKTHILLFDSDCFFPGFKRWY